MEDIFYNWENLSETEKQERVDNMENQSPNFLVEKLDYEELLRGYYAYANSTTLDEVEIEKRNAFYFRMRNNKQIEK